MVTVILLFIFISPHYIDFKDQPAEHLPHPTGITITPQGNEMVYEVAAPIVDAQDDARVRANLLRVIEPISGRVTLVKADPVRDRAGHIISYRAVVRK